MKELKPCISPISVLCEYRNTKLNYNRKVIYGDRIGDNNNLLSILDNSNEELLKEIERKESIIKNKNKKIKNLIKIIRDKNKYIKQNIDKNI